MGTGIWVSILGWGIHVSIPAKSSAVHLRPPSPQKLIGQTGFFKFCLVTSLGVGKLWIQFSFTLLKNWSWSIYRSIMILMFLFKKWNILIRILSLYLLYHCYILGKGHARPPSARQPRLTTVSRDMIHPTRSVSRDMIHPTRSVSRDMMHPTRSVSRDMIHPTRSVSRDMIHPTRSVSRDMIHPTRSVSRDMLYPRKRA